MGGDVARKKGGPPPVHGSLAWLKALTRMPRDWAERIRDKIRADADDPASQANNVRRLKGQDGLVRLRVGDWRILMRDGSVLQVLHVTGRGSAYKE